MKRALRRAAAVSAVVAAAFGYVHLAEEDGSPLAPGDAAPALVLPSLSGPPVDLAALRGQVVVLNFWATWCAPCVAEMPSLERLHRALGPEGLAVVTVSVDEDEAQLRAFVERHSLTLPVLIDPGGRAAAGAFHAVRYPQTFVLDRSGRLVRRYAGPARWDTPAALDHFRSLLAPGRSATGP